QHTPRPSLTFPVLINAPTPDDYTLSLHDALPILRETKMSAVLTENGFIDTKKDADFLKSDANLRKIGEAHAKGVAKYFGTPFARSEEHTSELQSRENLVCRLLLEKKQDKLNQTLP